ncbi:MAG: peptidylprolyl isomerase [Bryobacterales bacterium]|nr:peptidylprolyl isomerase [Bryobacterales bacterium]
MKFLFVSFTFCSSVLVYGQAKPATPASQQKTAAPAAAPAAPADPNAVVFKVGSESYTRAQFDQLIASLPERVQAEVRGPNKRKLADQLVELKVASQEARRRKLELDPKVKQQIALQTDNLLANALFMEVLDATKPTEADVKGYYETHKSEYEQVKARHILIRFQGSRVPLRANTKDLTEAEALAKCQELQKRIAGGEDFAAVAKSDSDDTGSGANGGDLGSFSHGQMVPQFDQTVFSLPVGKISDPVKTPFGYHLIQVQEHDNKNLEEVKSQIEQKLKPELAKKQIEELKKSTTITLDDAYFSK